MPLDFFFTHLLSNNQWIISIQSFKLFNSYMAITWHCRLQMLDQFYCLYYQNYQCSIWFFVGLFDLTVVIMPHVSALLHFIQIKNCTFSYWSTDSGLGETTGCLSGGTSNYLFVFSCCFYTSSVFALHKCIRVLTNEFWIYIITSNFSYVVTLESLTFPSYIWCFKCNFFIRACKINALW